MPITVDLQARTIDPNERIYVIRPGKEYRFYNEFISQKAVFLDLPGLAYQYSTEPNQQTLARILLRSARVRAWHLQGADPASAPNRNIQQYTVTTVPKARAQLAGAYRELHFAVPKGALILVPGAGYFSDVYVGEISDELDDDTSVTVQRYANEVIPARQVKWLSRIPKWNFSPEMVKRLQLRSPLVHLSEEFKDELIKLAFPNYTYGNLRSSQFITTKADFTSRDDLSIEMFVNHVAGILAALETNSGVSGFDPALDLLDQHPEFVPELTLDINSPGRLSLLSDQITPIVIAALMTAALVQPANAAKPQIIVQNTLNVTDICLPPVNQRVEQALARFSGDDWNAHCKRIQSTHHRTGFRPQTKVDGNLPKAPPK